MSPFGDCIQNKKFTKPHHNSVAESQKYIHSALKDSVFQLGFSFCSLKPIKNSAILNFLHFSQQTKQGIERPSE